MGAEAAIACRTPWGDGNAKAHLDSQALTLSGAVRGRLALSDVRKAVVDGDELVIAAKPGTLRLTLGARTAALWARKILNPPSLADKLGLKAGVGAKLVGAVPDEVTRAAKGHESAKPDLVLAAIDDAAQAAKLARHAKSAKALWLVFRKGPTGPGETAIIMAARAAGLKDTKVARVSETHTALRFIAAD
jgi:hypothetical protein